MKHVKCSKCGHIGPENEFPRGRDFFQNAYISSCPKDCGNRQSPGGASMRMFGGERPFVYAEQPRTDGSVLAEVLKRAEEAS